MTQTKSLLYGIMTAIVLAIIFLVGASSQRVDASAFPGGQATVASSSIYAATAATASSLIATSSCSARIITTGASAVMLTFSDYSGQAPTGSFGHWQAASTTVAYDSGQYGCGLVKGFSYTAQLMTLTDVR